MPLTVKCSKCPYEGKQKQAIDHYLKRHVPNKDVPYFCILCNFKAATKVKWDKHVNSYPNHRKCAEICKMVLSDENYCQISNKQFKLDISKDGDLIPIEKPVVSNTPVDMVPDYSEEVVVEGIIIQEDSENQNVFKLEEEIETLKNKLNEERQNFERYIGKMEKTKTSMNKEIQTMKKELENEKKENMKIELKNTEEELKEIRTKRKRQRSRSPSTTHILSEVHVVPPKKSRNYLTNNWRSNYYSVPVHSRPNYSWRQSYRARY